MMTALRPDLGKTQFCDERGRKRIAYERFVGQPRVPHPWRAYAGG